MFDDDAGWHVKSLHALPGRVGISNIVVRQLLALQLAIRGQAAGYASQITVKRRALVGIFSVTQCLHAVELHVQSRRERFTAAVRLQRRQIIADRAVIGGRMRKRLAGKTEARICAECTSGRTHLLQQSGVIGGVGDHRNMLIVLRRAAHHRRAADVDVFDRIFQRAVRLGDGLGKRVKVDADQVDAGNPRLLHRRHMFRQIAAAEQPGMDARVQRLHAAVEHFGKTGVVGDFGDFQSGFAQQLRGAASGQQRHAETGKAACKINDTRLVGNAD